jgi:hypothetical protein
MNGLIGRMFGLRHFNVLFALTFLSQLALSLGRGSGPNFRSHRLLLFRVGRQGPPHQHRHYGGASQHPWRKEPPV